MYRTLIVVVCWLVLVSVSRADGWNYAEVPGSFPIPRPSHNVKDWGPLDYDDTPGAVPGGLVFIRQNGQWIVRFGGGLLPMRIRMTEPGPDGPVTSRMILPSAAQSAALPLALQHHAPLFTAPSEAAPHKPAPDRACVQIHIPDPSGVLYLDGKLTNTRGTTRQLESPPLEFGKTHVFKLRAGFQVGENLLIEEKEVLVRAGELSDVTFDGARAKSVPLPRSGR
jgi:uncharacterized protein (TIGR03000 family)